MTISRQDNSKGPKPGKPTHETGGGKFGPAFPGNTARSAAQDPDVNVAYQGTSGGDTVKHPIYSENAQQPGN